MSASNIGGADYTGSINGLRSQKFNYNYILAPKRSNFLNYGSYMFVNVPKSSFISALIAITSLAICIKSRESVNCVCMWSSIQLFNL